MALGKEFWGLHLGNMKGEGKEGLGWPVPLALGGLTLMTGLRAFKRSI